MNPTTMRLNRNPFAFIRAPLAALAFLATLAFSSLAGLSDKIAYQGYLTDGTGAALGNPPQNYKVTFAIYDKPTGGANLWNEDQTVTVNNGYFSVLLGEGTAPSGNHDLLSVIRSHAGDELYVGISVLVDGNTVEILPRLRLLPSPFSLIANSAFQLVDATGTNSVISADAAGSVTFNTAFNSNLALQNKANTFSGANTFVAPVTFNGDLSVGDTYSLIFGAKTRQMLHLYRTSAVDYGIGVQGSTLYFRAGAIADGFSWFAGGSHDDSKDNPGANGIRLMRLDQNELSVRGKISTGTDIAAAGSVSAKGNLTVDGMVSAGDLRVGGSPVVRSASPIRILAGKATATVTKLSGFVPTYSVTWHVRDSSGAVDSSATAAYTPGGVSVTFKTAFSQEPVVTVSPISGEGDMRLSVIDGGGGFRAFLPGQATTAGQLLSGPGITSFTFIAVGLP